MVVDSADNDRYGDECDVVCSGQRKRDGIFHANNLQSDVLRRFDILPAELERRRGEFCKGNVHGIRRLDDGGERTRGNGGNIRPDGYSIKGSSHNRADLKRAF